MSDLTKKPVVLSLAGTDAIAAQEDLAFTATDGHPLAFDLYSPSEPGRPVVVFVSGFPDPGGKLKRMAAYPSWARLVAASGMAAVTYANREPVADLSRLLAHLRHAALGVDGARVALWACSGNVPTALATLAHEPVVCAALLYGYCLDDASGALAQAAARFGFLAATRGLSLDDLPRALPLHLVRAGRDEMPGLNSTIDALVAAALARDQPLGVDNVAGAPHAFDLIDDRDASRAAIARVLAFLRCHLLGAIDRR